MADEEVALSGVKKNGGKNKHQVTEDNIKKVQMLAQYGVKTEYIAAEIGISEPTLFVHYQEYMDKARASAHYKMGSKIFHQGINGCTKSQAIYASCQMGWKSTQKQEHSGPDGKPIETEVTVSAHDKLNNFLGRLGSKNAD